MFNFIKNLFKKDEDANRTAIVKLFDGNWRVFDDMEQAVIMLRLSGMSKEQTADALDTTLTTLEKTEQRIIKRLKK